MSAVHTEFQTQPLRMSEIPFFQGGGSAITIFCILILPNE